jgi:hypothetical protein
MAAIPLLFYITDLSVLCLLLEASQSDASSDASAWQCWGPTLSQISSVSWMVHTNVDCDLGARTLGPHQRWVRPEAGGDRPWPTSMVPARGSGTTLLGLRWLHTDGCVRVTANRVRHGGIAVWPLHDSLVVCGYYKPTVPTKMGEQPCGNWSTT